MRDSDWQTRYYGRFKLDLPKNSEDSAYYKIYNEKIDLISKNGKKKSIQKPTNLLSSLNLARREVPIAVMKKQFLLIMEVF